MTVRPVDRKDPVGQGYGLDIPLTGALPCGVCMLLPKYPWALSKFSDFLQQSKNMLVK